ncbi:hypothetical protein CALVIDRAFT_194295 [Calocera viscosa TUFC12733]|uniref:Uncharacterized protein n=1 Tax=Calocera viscosa (strain TUFC12733) TaxID=1330018 RepID=A0A167KRU8_CALVF|nr:hypothetical protein CALVIDRAFT_194295 [Calocera viscosa TUFC12733]
MQSGCRPESIVHADHGQPEECRAEAGWRRSHIPIVLAVVAQECRTEAGWRRSHISIMASLRNAGGSGLGPFVHASHNEPKECKTEAGWDRSCMPVVTSLRNAEGLVARADRHQPEECSLQECSRSIVHADRHQPDECRVQERPE